jgi:hypothetical protein
LIDGDVDDSSSSGGGNNNNNNNNNNGQEYLTGNEQSITMTLFLILL